MSTGKPSRTCCRLNKMAFRYTIDQLAFLEAGYPALSLVDLTKKFNRFFGLDKTTSQIKSTLTNHSITCGRPTGRARGYSFLFTPEQVCFIRKNYAALSPLQLTEAVNKKFTLQVTAGQIKSFVKNHGIVSGRTGRFEKGNKPWNTGTRGQGICKPNSGNFRKGDVPANSRPLGSERVCSKDGFILVKVAEENPYTGAKTRFRHKHVLEYEKHNGPVPEGMIVRLMDGDPTNCEPGNLLLVTRAEHLYLNRMGLSNYPGELKPTVVAIAKLEAKTFSRQKERKER